MPDLIVLIILSIADLVIGKGFFWALDKVDTLTPAPAFIFFCVLICINGLVIDIVEKVTKGRLRKEGWYCE